MTQARCATPIPLATLVEYWLGELDPAQEGRLDEHLLGCDLCSANLQSVVDLAGGVRAAVRAGAVGAVVPAAFVERLGAHGMRVREYRVPHNGSVHCTVAPDDDLLVSRLQAPLAGVERVDLERSDGDAEAPDRLRDVHFDAAGGEVVIAHRMDRVRVLPATTLRIRLLDVTASGERVVGEYTFNHTPWPAQERR